MAKKASQTELFYVLCSSAWMYCMYVALLWTIPAQQTVLTVGSDRIKNVLIQLAILNHKDWCFKFQNRRVHNDITLLSLALEVV